MPVPYDKLVDKYFAVGSDGTTVFCPRLGSRRGYRVLSPERERAIRARLGRRLKIWRWVLAFVLLTIIVGGSFAMPYRLLAWGLGAAVLLSGLVYLFLSNRALTRGLELVSVPMTATAQSSGYLKRFAGRQSAVAHLTQAIVLGALAIYTTDKTLKVGATAMDLLALVILWPLALLGTAGFLVRISNRSAGEGPSPDQLYLRSVRRPVWLVIIALLAIALIELFVQAAHRPKPPTRQVSSPAADVLGQFDNSLRITT